MKLIKILALGLACLWAADRDVTPQRISITKTEHADLPAGAILHLSNSTGELMIEGSDQTDVEIMTIKSTKLEYVPGAEHDKAARMLDEVSVTESQHGGELLIETVFPRHRRFLPRPSVGSRDFDLEYRIRVPRDTKVIVDHDAGEIHLDNVAGDVHATTNQGIITLRLPTSGRYSIDARSRIGNVISDFPGTTNRKKFVGHEYIERTQAPHSLFLRDGFGDIVITQIRQPEAL